MKRRYFVTDDLDSVENIETELKDAGFDDLQIHVVSSNEAEADKLQLNEVNSILKKDILRSGFKGAVIGLILAAVALLIGVLFNAQTFSQWIPYLVVAAILFGFATWEGGFIGIQEPNAVLKHFHPYLKAGKHILFVDTKGKQEKALVDIVETYKGVSEINHSRLGLA